MTTEQIQNRSKTVTRRFGWRFLQPGDLVRAVEKGMGLKKGEKMTPLALIQIVSCRWEPLNAITQADLVREGFPTSTPDAFVERLSRHYRVPPDTLVHRIEFIYLSCTFAGCLWLGVQDGHCALHANKASGRAPSAQHSGADWLGKGG